MVRSIWLPTSTKGRRERYWRRELETKEVISRRWNVFASLRASGRICGDEALTNCFARCHDGGYSSGIFGPVFLG